MNLAVPKDYEFLSAQKELRSLSEVSMAVSEPKEPRVLAIYQRVSKAVSPASHDFFAKLFVEVKKDFPFFTSRDLRNIQQAINARVLNFDFPEA